MLLDITAGILSALWFVVITYLQDPSFNHLTCWKCNHLFQHMYMFTCLHYMLYLVI